jgi:hypothetical protein
MTADRAMVHLTDTRFFVLARTVDVLLVARNDATINGRTRPSGNDLKLGPRLRPLVDARSVWIEPSRPDQ